MSTSSSTASAAAGLRATACSGLQLVDRVDRQILGGEPPPRERWRTQISLVSHASGRRAHLTGLKTPWKGGSGATNLQISPDLSSYHHSSQSGEPENPRSTGRSMSSPVTMSSDRRARNRSNSPLE